MALYRTCKEDDSIVVDGPAEVSVAKVLCEGGEPRVSLRVAAGPEVSINHIPRKRDHDNSTRERSS